MEKTEDGKECIPGHFYWVMPIFDVDSDLSFEDQYKFEPGKYLGDDKWSLLGTEDGVEYPVRRIHSEIIPPGVD